MVLNPPRRRGTPVVGRRRSPPSPKQRGLRLSQYGGDPCLKAARATVVQKRPRPHRKVVWTPLIQKLASAAFEPPRHSSLWKQGPPPWGRGPLRPSPRRGPRILWGRWVPPLRRRGNLRLLDHRGLHRIRTTGACVALHAGDSLALGQPLPPQVVATPESLGWNGLRIGSPRGPMVQAGAVQPPPPP